MITKILIAIILIFSCFSITSFLYLMEKAIDKRTFKGLAGEVNFFLFCFLAAIYFSFIYYFY